MLTLACAAAANAQTIDLLGGTMTVAEGTTVQLTGPLQLTIQPGATLVNNGTMDLGTEATLSEPDGNPIRGAGVEVARTVGNGPFSAAEPGALGLTFTATEQEGPVEVIRGHATYYFPEGDPSIARWFSLGAPNGGNGDVQVVLRYDATELNALAGSSLGIFRAPDETGPWLFVSSTNDALAQTVSADLIAPWPVITAFDANAPTASPSLVVQEGIHVWPTLTSGEVFVHALDGTPLDRIDVVDALGRVVPVQIDRRSAVLARLDLSGSAIGAYFLRIDGRSTFKLRRE